MLIRYLPRDSALVAEMNDGDPVWSSTEHLLADLWAVLVKVNSDPKRTPKDLDHPTRSAIRNRAKAAEKRRLKDVFLERKKNIR